jgi:hypothetical protein
MAATITEGRRRWGRGMRQGGGTGVEEEGGGPTTPRDTSEVGPRM